MTEVVVVSCFLHFGDFGDVSLRWSPEPAQRTRWRKNAPRRKEEKKKKKSIPAQQMEPRAGEEEEESGEG